VAANPSWTPELFHEVLDEPQNYPLTGRLAQVLSAYLPDRINDAHLMKLARHPQDEARLMVSSRAGLSPAVWDILSKDANPLMRRQAYLNAAVKTPEMIDMMLADSDEGVKQTAYSESYTPFLQPRHWQKMVDAATTPTSMLTLLNKKPKLDASGYATILDRVNGPDYPSSYRNAARHVIAQTPDLPPETVSRLINDITSDPQRDRSADVHSYLSRNESIADKITPDDYRKLFFSPYASYWVHHNNMPMELLAERLNDPRLDQDTKDQIKSRMVEETPDALHNERVHVGFDLGKLRMIRDFITEQGKDQLQPNKLPPGDWKIGRLPNGNISAKKLQEAIDNAPKIMYNVSHSRWRGSQRHNIDNSRVFQVNLTNDQVQKMKQAKVWGTWRKIKGRFYSSGHPATPSTLGWVRWTGGPEDWGEGDDGVFIDEVQSDLGQNFQKIVSADARADAERRRAAGEEVDVEAAVRAAEAKAQKDYPSDHLKAISQILFNGRHSNELLHEAFQQWWRDPHTARKRVVIAGLNNGVTAAPAPVADPGYPDMKMQTHSIASKSPISLGRQKQAAPVHFQHTYKDIPIKKLAWTPTKYGELKNQQKEVSYEHLPGSDTLGGKVRKYEVEQCWDTYFDPADHYDYDTLFKAEDDLNPRQQRLQHYMDSADIYAQIDGWTEYGQFASPEQVQQAIDSSHPRVLRILVDTAPQITPEQAEKLWAKYGQQEGAATGLAMASVLVGRADCPLSIRKQAAHNNTLAKYVHFDAPFRQEILAHPAEYSTPSMKEAVLAETQRQPDFCKAILNSPAWESLHGTIAANRNSPQEAKQAYMEKVANGQAPQDNIAQTVLFTMRPELAASFVGRVRASLFTALVSHGTYNSLPEEAYKKLWEQAKVEQDADSGTLMRSVLIMVRPSAETAPIFNEALQSDDIALQKTAVSRAAAFKANPEQIDYIVKLATNPVLDEYNRTDMQSAVVGTLSHLLNERQALELAPTLAPNLASHFLHNLAANANGQVYIKAVAKHMLKTASTEGVAHTALQNIPFAELNMQEFNDTLKRLPAVTYYGIGHYILGLGGERPGTLPPEMISTLIAKSDSDMKHSIGSRPDLTKEHYLALMNDPDSGVRSMILKNPSLPADIVDTVINTGTLPAKRSIAMFNGNLTPTQQKLLYADREPDVWQAMVQNANLHPDIISDFLKDPDRLASLERTRPIAINNWLNIQPHHLITASESPSVRMRTQAVNHPLLPLEQLSKLVNDPDQRVSAIAKEHMVTHDPDSVLKERVGVRYNVGKYRKIRDFIENKGVKALPPKDLPKGDWTTNNAVKDKSGNISAELVQKFIDSQPTSTFNVSHGKGTKAGDIHKNHLYDPKNDLAPSADEDYVWSGGQRHNDDPSKLFLVHVTSDHVRQMKEAGVYNTYRKMNQKSMSSSHPATQTTVGWVRYTGHPKHGIFIDEVQSDFGQSFLRQYLHQVEQRRARGENVGDAEINDFAREYPDDHFNMINKIVFGGKHSNEALHEAFQQYLRDRGHSNSRVSIHSVESKAKISLGRPEDTAPGHFQVTYRDVPQKRLGWDPSKYGTMPTQNNQKMQGQATWEGMVRKFEEEWLAIGEPLEKAPKAQMSQSRKEAVITRLLRHANTYERTMALTRDGVTERHLEMALRDRSNSVQRRAAMHPNLTPALIDRVFNGQIPVSEDIKSFIIRSNSAEMSHEALESAIRESYELASGVLANRHSNLTPADVKLALDTYGDEDEYGSLIAAAMDSGKMPKNPLYLDKFFLNDHITNWNKLARLRDGHTPEEYVHSLTKRWLADDDSLYFMREYISHVDQLPPEILSSILESKKPDAIQRVLVNNNLDWSPATIKGLFDGAVQEGNTALVQTMLEHRPPPAEDIVKLYNDPRPQMQSLALSSKPEEAPPDFIQRLIDQGQAWRGEEGMNPFYAPLEQVLDSRHMTPELLGKMLGIRSASQSLDIRILHHPKVNDTIKTAIIRSGRLAGEHLLDTAAGLGNNADPQLIQAVLDASQQPAYSHWKSRIQGSLSHQARLIPAQVNEMVSGNSFRVLSGILDNDGVLNAGHYEHIFNAALTGNIKADDATNMRMDNGVAHRILDRVVSSGKAPADASLRLADSDDGNFQLIALKDPALPPDRVMKILANAGPTRYEGAGGMSVKLAALKHPNLPDEALNEILANSGSRDILNAVLENPKLTDAHIAPLFDRLNDLGAETRNVLYRAPAVTPALLDKAKAWEEAASKNGIYTGSMEALNQEFGHLNPDGLYPDRLDVRYDTGKLRKIRDIILGEGREDKPAKELPQGIWTQGNTFRGPNGNISATKIQQFIDAQTPIRYNYSHGKMSNLPLSTYSINKDKGTWTGGQRHSKDPSKLMLLHISTDHVNKLKEAGVYRSFRKVASEHYSSGHPATPHTIGWVRYTGTPKTGIFIDEIQSDIGQAFNRQVHGDDSAEIPIAHYPIISKILFNGRHPNEAIHESFQQMLRDRGHHAARVSIHTPATKAPLSGVGQDDGKGGTIYPGHFYVTYKEVPQKKLGWEPSTYGTMRTQTNPEIKGKPIWEGIVRKFEQVDARMSFAKNIGYILFPQLGYTRPHTQPYIAPDITSKFMGAGANYQTANDINNMFRDGGGGGAMFDNVAQGFRPKEERRHFGVVLPGKRFTTPSVVDHETQHGIFAQIGLDHGAGVRQKVIHHLLNNLPPDLDDAVSKGFSVRHGYEKDVNAPEEAIAFMHNYLQDPKDREIVHKRLALDPFQARAYQTKMKQAWRHMRDSALSIKPADVGLDYSPSK
jgi:hypothetical protein